VICDPERGIYTCDVSEPTQPRPAGCIKSVSIPWDVVERGEYLIVATGNTGLVTGRMVEPEIFETTNMYALSGDALGLTVQGEVAYVASDYDGLRVVDISDPTQPVEIGSLDERETAFKVDVVGNLLAMVDTSCFKIVNISNPRNPVLLSSYQTWGYISDIELTDNIAYIADASNGLLVLSLEHPERPHLITTLDAGEYPQALQIVGHHLLVGSNDGTRIFSILRPEAPELAGYYLDGRTAAAFIEDHGYIYSKENSRIGIYRLTGELDAGLNDIVPPSVFVLYTPFPNPFNSSTLIRFDLPNRANVLLSVHDLAGREVAMLATGEISAGTHSVRWDAGNFASGIYLVRLKTPGFTKVNKMTLVK